MVRSESKGEDVWVDQEVEKVENEFAGNRRDVILSIVLMNVSRDHWLCNRWRFKRWILMFLSFGSIFPSKMKRIPERDEKRLLACILHDDLVPAQSESAGAGGLKASVDRVVAVPAVA